LSESLTFARDFEPTYGEPVVLSPRLARLTARNPSPFTFFGTNTYLVGHETVAVVDPGPEDEAHLAAILQAVGARPIDAILVTHTHRDHSPIARALAAATGAPILGAGPHRPARPLHEGEADALEGSGDRLHAPDRVLRDGETVEGKDWTLTAIATPGHTENHLAFALPAENALLSGDHVMAWSTSVIAPPDGSMAHYRHSLARLLERDDEVYWPGHGGPVTRPRAFVRGLLAHRRAREEAILGGLRNGARTIPALVARIYHGLDPRLGAAAGLSVFAHLEDLANRGLVVSEDGGALRLDAAYRLA
jgi:glyoxylase-like metal-dependent hydrolase (beta-lactamase superfamily II)